MSRIGSERFGNLTGVIGGLVSLEKNREMHAESLSWAASRYALEPGALERYVPPMSCFRTVSQRSLSTRSTFLSANFNTPSGWGGSNASYFQQMLTDPTTGAIIPPAGEETLKFLDANRQSDRADIAGLVLIGMRSKIALKFFFGGTIAPGVPEVTDVSSGQLVETVKDFIRDYVAIALFHTPDDIVQTGAIVAGAQEMAAEPWMGWTPLRYFDRPGGAFLPVPMLLWPTGNRDPNAQISVRQAFDGTGVNPAYNGQLFPKINTAIAEAFPAQVYALTYQLSIMVEALFVPSPEDCPPGTWPGVLAPSHKIGLHPDYNPALPMYRDPVAGKRKKPAPETCTGCNCKAPSRPELEVDGVKLSLLDARFNVREAAKQMLLLEHHLVEKRKVCPDCIQKHCLTIEAYGEEGISLEGGRGEAGDVCSDIARYARSLERRWEAGEDRKELAKSLRRYRKSVTKALRRLTANGRD